MTFKANNVIDNECKSSARARYSHRDLASEPSQLRRSDSTHAAFGARRPLLPPYPRPASSQKGHGIGARRRLLCPSLAFELQARALSTKHIDIRLRAPSVPLQRPSAPPSNPLALERAAYGRIPARRLSSGAVFHQHVPRTTRRPTDAGESVPRVRGKRRHAKLCFQLPSFRSENFGGRKVPRRDRQRSLLLRTNCHFPWQHLGLLIFCNVIILISDYDGDNCNDNISCFCPLILGRELDARHDFTRNPIFLFSH